MNMINGIEVKAGDMVRTCSCCGKQFVITATQIKKFKELKFELPVRCKECNDLKKSVISITCTSCGATFTLDALRERQLKQKYGDKYVQPKHCPECRLRRKGGM